MLHDENPCFTVSLKEISDVLGVKVKKWNPSAITVHPKTKDIYMIATSGQLLVVLDSKTKVVVYVEYLPREPFVQPEGM